MFNARKLFELRNNLKLSRRELAEKVGVVSSTVANWEYEIIQPRLGKIQKIASALGVDIDELLFIDSENKNIENNEEINKILLKIQDEVIELNDLDLKVILQIIRKYKR